ncbi:hypothetical protein BCR43DRAFT_486825 [Syncephalastrum racemosum]|uniref:Uncharacterized protein n=1 Tax=Syncephalastrum racemosum TaxID=13706 RepID=A0A1X2HPQ7_SYNRA|nr:hypothetical protein BCR43DRAFT_486825 [Syncephalastrum racemosum]
MHLNHLLFPLWTQTPPPKSSTSIVSSSTLYTITRLNASGVTSPSTSMRGHFSRHILSQSFAIQEDIQHTYGDTLKNIEALTSIIFLKAYKFPNARFSILARYKAVSIHVIKRTLILSLKHMLDRFTFFNHGFECSARKSLSTISCSSSRSYNTICY